MKKSMISLAILISGFLIESMLITSCNGKPKQEQTEHEHDAMKNDSTQVVYACSMHPEVTGKEGDKCSTCGMKLEAVKSTDSTTSHHDH